MNEIEAFYKRIPDGDKLSAGQLIPYFVFYCSKNAPTNSSEIRKCFESLRIAPYSNIPSYVKRKSTGSDALLI